MSKRMNYYTAAPEAMKAMMAAEKAVGETSLPKTLRELVKLRASQINGCAFCVDMHAADLQKEGIDTRKLMAVSVWRETPFFTEQERAALLWAETLTRVAENHVPDEVYQQAITHFSEKELAELTFVIGIINAWNRFGVAFAVHPK